MATSDIEHIDRIPVDEIQTTVSSVKSMLKVGGVLVIVGYLLLLFALTQEVSTLSPVFAEETMKMWLKLGGVGHILLGIFVSLVAIVRVLSLMPHRLGYEMERTQQTTGPDN